MHRIIRGHGRISIAVGWLLAVMGVAALITFLVLAFVLDEPWMLWFLFAPVIAWIGAAINFWLGYRSRLEVTQEGATWNGVFGTPGSIAWRDVRQILVPPPGSPRRLAAVAAMRDGSFVEITAMWISPTAPSMVLGGRPDHSEALEALIDGHRAYLAAAAVQDGQSQRR